MAASTRGRPILSGTDPGGRVFIESYVGVLLPSPPWSGRLVAASAKAISIIHPDGAVISVVGRSADMEARAMMPASGFSGFAAKSADLLEHSGRHHTDSMNAGSQFKARWDGQKLSLARSMEQMQTQPQKKAQDSIIRAGNQPILFLDFGQDPSVWDPRVRLAGAARRFCRGTPRGNAAEGMVPDAQVLAAEVRALLADAYSAGRRAEGLHGSGAFAQGFKRLEADPDFPAVVVGFGPGTTPAGDDWLAGLLVAIDLRTGMPGEAAADLRQDIRRRLQQTTAAGRSLLLGALAGAPPEYLVGLAEAAAEWVPAAQATPEALDGPALELASLRAAVSNCLGHGATSGEDALAGFVFGLGADIHQLLSRVS